MRLVGRGIEGGEMLRRERLRLGFLLGGPIFMHGAVKFTCFQRYGS